MTGQPLSLDAYPGFLATGPASTFLEGVLAMTFLLNRLGLPTNLVQLYITLDQVAVARIGTLLACMSVLSLVIISTWVSLKQTRKRRGRYLPAALAFLLTPLFIGISHQAFNAFPAPVNNQRLKLLNQDFAVAHGPAAIDDSPEILAEAGSWDAIQRRGEIHYCVLEHDHPMSFRNSRKELVGADVEMGLLFAEQMGLEARFHTLNPVTSKMSNEALKTAFFSRNDCDMGLSEVVLNPQLSADFLSTKPEDKFSVSLLLTNNRYSGIHQWDDLTKFSNLKVGTLKGKTFLNHWIDKLIPDARFIQDKNNAALVQALIHSKIDVLLMAAEKASSWTVLYPQLRIVVPQPVRQVSKTRLFPRDAQTFLRTWENWIDFQITTGTKQTVFDHWVEGINKS